PRPMRCIQGSDAHRLVRESEHSKNLGVGDRVTEILLDEVSFEALARVLKGNDFSLTRPDRGKAKPIDFVQLAREEGESIVQSFHESTAQRGGYLDSILRDICAMANTNGGIIYVGVSAEPEEKPAGVREPKRVIDKLYATITNRFSPEPDVQIDSLTSQGKRIVRISVQPGNKIPYAIDNNNFYVRDESETNLAVRDEIVRLVELGMTRQSPNTAENKVIESKQNSPAVQEPEIPRRSTKVEPPRTGVEIVSSEQRQGTIYHTVRDLRNGNLIHNVTKSSARKLWHYAITQEESGTNISKSIQWHKDMAVIRQRKKGDNIWYDLALRDNNQIHIYYGVTDSGMNDEWLALVGEDS
ncbi:MAG: ATP-binding protein, partial [Candidatus Promineifilaceae bacterium]|nr:ATP-binding protein [Candidatus Promineifilaceae bacterium]